MHKVTLEEIQPAMEREIVLASSCDAKTKSAKDLKFYPSELKYRVRFYDGNSETSNSYFNPLMAIEKYNGYDA
jgi:hypothetical protein